MKGFHCWCGLSGTIYAGTDRSRHDVTEEAVHSVALKLLPDDYDVVNSVTMQHSNGKKVRLSCEWLDEDAEKEAPTL